MSGTEAMQSITLPAGADLSALQFTAIKMGTGKTAASATSAAAPIIGILQNKPDAAGKAAEVAISGIAKALAGSGGWTTGAKLTATTGGALIATVTDHDHYVGIAVETTAAGARGQVLIQPGMVSL